MSKSSKYIARISLDQPNMAIAELIELLGIKVIRQDNYLCFFEGEIDQSVINRLAYTGAVYEIIGSWPMNQLPKKLESTIQESSYKVKFITTQMDISKELANTIFRLVHDSCEKPVVDLKEPKIIIGAAIDSQKKLFLTKLVYDNDRAYEKRKSHTRERTHPSAMPPKLIRAMINLTGVTKGKILDPFCGTGGFPIEAMYCGLHVLGSDIDGRMTGSTRINIKNEILKNPHFEKLCDPNEDIQKISATQITTSADAMVMDVPYGKNTKKLTNDNLYLDFLLHVQTQKLTKKLVICLPNKKNNGIGEEIIAKTKWKIKHKISLRVHNSLTREVFVLAI